MSKKALSWMIIAIMVFTIFGSGQSKAFANGVYDGEINIETGTGTGSGWTFVSPTLTISAPGYYRIYGTGTETNNRIVVNANVSATIMVEDVSISTIGCAMDIQAGIGTVDLVLKDGSANILESLASGGANPGIMIGENATLRISGETGDTAFLDVLGAGSDSYAAGIGGPTGGAGGNLVINSGFVDVYGDYTGQTGAVIGNGGGGSFGSITINGGYVSAIPIDVSTFGIGGPYCGDITINGGTVTAAGTSYCAAMFTGNDITINGGSVNLSSVYSTAMAVGSGSNITVNDGILNVTKNWVWGTAIDTSTGNLIIKGGLVTANGGVSGQTLILDAGDITVFNGDINMPVTTTEGTPSSEGGVIKLPLSIYSVTINGTVTGDFELDLNHNEPGFANPVITSSLSENGSFVTRDGSYDLIKTSDALKSYWRLKASADAALIVLNLSSGTLTPSFDGGIYAYTASVPYSTSSLTVTPMSSNSYATVEVNGLSVPRGSESEPISLNVGSNTINVAVTAQDGTTTHTYTVDVTRNEAPSTDATLSGLSLSDGTLTPVFDGGTFTYTASVPYSANSITVTPTANNGNATVKVNDVTVSSGNPSGPIGLNVGSNTINVAVTAQDGTTTQTYNVDVTRNEAPSTDATLSGLSLSDGTLTPVFNGGTFAYTASVPYSANSITVTPTTNGNATVRVNDVTVSSGNPSGPISLNVGSNTINIAVTAQDGITTETYAVVVTRDTAAPTDCIVTFDSNGGSVVGSITASINTKINEPAPPPTKPGYTFAGWYTDDNTFEKRFDFANTAITEDIILHAKWVENPKDEESKHQQKDHEKSQYNNHEKCIAYTGLLRSGSSGSAVRELQQELNVKGYALAADGIFGPKTKAAVMKFQKSQGIAVDGIVGPVTWGRLFGGSWKDNSCRTLLMQGSAGTAVKEVQKVLNKKGYVLAADGVFGPKTKAAVTSFQRSQGIAADGIVGDITWGRLFSWKDQDVSLIMY
jgi:uncharacterized repeat protein (TIGR02543 family)